LKVRGERASCVELLRDPTADTGKERISDAPIRLFLDAIEKECRPGVVRRKLILLTKEAEIKLNCRCKLEQIPLI
jgi:hypothetical protein